MGNVPVRIHLMTKQIALLAVLISLVACSGEGDVRTAHVTGELTYLERIALPPGAQAQVMLRTAPRYADMVFDPAAKSTLPDPGALIAEHTIDIAQPVPIPFRLEYRLNGLDPARLLVVDAWIFSDDQVLFALPEAPEIQMGSGAPLQLTLRRPRHVTYACTDGSRPTIAFPLMGSLAFLEAQGVAPIALRAEPVGSGFLYSGWGYGLRGKGREALLRRPSGDETRCESAAP